MPYITLPEREVLDPAIEQLHRSINTIGALNYTVTRLCSKYYHSKVGYQAIAEVTGMLSNVANELYRRIFVNYEDDKIYTNGDIKWR